jgi:predicted double-glycine peptidase
MAFFIKNPLLKWWRYFMYFIYQGNEADCGYASLKMLIAYYQKDKNFLYLKKSDNKEKNYSFLDLISIAKIEGVALKGIKNANLQDNEAFKKPYLAVVKVNDMNHMVFVRKTVKNVLLVYDPDLGVRLISMKKFLAMFTGLALICDETTSKKCDIKKKNPYKNSKLIALVSCQILSLCLFFASLATIAMDISQTITIGLFIVYILAELLYECFLLKSLKTFDEEYIPLISRAGNKNRALGLINDYKKSIFGKPFECITSIVIVASVVFTLAMNGSFYLLVFIIAGLLVTMISIISYSKTNKLRRDSIVKENEIIEGNCTDIKTFLNSTYQIVSFSILKRFLYLIIGLACSLSLMVLLKENSLNFVLFYLFIYVIAIEKLSMIINYALESGDRQKLDAEFRDLFL